MITKEEILKLARLARLSVNETEANAFLVDLNTILGAFEKLQSLDVSKITPMSHTHGAVNVFRADEVQASFPPEEAIAMAPDHSGRFIRVPIVMDQGSED